MKSVFLSLALLLAGSVAVPAHLLARQDAGQDVKEGATKSTHAVKKGATKSTHAVKEGTEKSTHAVKRGVHKTATKVSDKTTGSPQ